MTGPFDPDHDLPEPVPVVLPVFGRYTPSFTGWPEAPVTRVALPFGWGPVVHPDLGLVVGHLVRKDLPMLGPSGVPCAAEHGVYGFRVVR